MATSGQLNTNTTYDSYFWVEWHQIGDQDIPNNRTQISWSCGVNCGHSFYSNAIKMSAFSINGVQVYGGGTYSNYSKGNHTIASGTMWIGHNTDGTKTFSISSFTGWLYSNYNYSSNGGSYSLTTIPRQATLTSAPNFTDQNLPTVYYSNAAGNSVEKLEICIADNRAYYTYADYREISKTGTSYTFKSEDVNALKNITVNTLSISFVLRTKIAGKYYHSTLYKTFTVTENNTTKPTVSMSISPVSTLGEPFNSMYIQGKTKVKAELTFGFKYGASIDGSCINVQGVDYGAPYESGYLTRSGYHVVTGAVRDSRGFYGTAQQGITVIEYSKPLVIPLSSEKAIHCYRSDGNGKRVGNSTSIWIKAKRSYYSVEGKNTCALEWRWKKASEVWNDSDHEWNDLISTTATTNEFNALIPGVVFELKDAYTVQIRAIDTIGEYDIKTFDVPTQDVALHLGAGGKNVSVGSYCDYSKDYTFHSEWDAIFDKSINGVYVKAVEVSGWQDIRIQTVYPAWTDNGNSRQSFLVFGSSNGALVHGVCNVNSAGAITGNDITNCSAVCEGSGVLKLTLGLVSWDIITIISAKPFTILQE